MSTSVLAAQCPHCRNTYCSAQSQTGLDEAQGVDACAFRRVAHAKMQELHGLCYKHQEVEILAENVHFRYLMINPDTGRRSRKHNHSGTIEKVVRLLDGRISVMLSRLSNDDIRSGASYWANQRLKSENYELILGARSLRYPVESVLYDVMRIPALRPGTATPEENRKYTKDGRLFCNQRETDESPEHFSRRVYEAVVADPERYFRREEIVYPPSDLALYQRGRWLTRNNVIL